MFINDWSDLEGMLRDFQVDRANTNIREVLFASYTYEDYNGDAYVLYLAYDGKYYEVNGSHCSCNGLEGQWEPEEANLTEMYHRLTKGTFGESRGITGPLLSVVVKEINKPRYELL
jgi:hypothetical protein